MCLRRSSRRLGMWLLKVIREDEVSILSISKTLFCSFSPVSLGVSMLGYS
jgi:hypothetical protein